jgi:hypothetical protein
MRHRSLAPALGAIRDRHNRFFVDHEVAWELTMAALSIAFVVVGIVTLSTVTMGTSPRSRPMAGSRRPR